MAKTAAYRTTRKLCVDGTPYPQGAPIDPPAGSLEIMLRLGQIEPAQASAQAEPPTEPEPPKKAAKAAK